MKLIVAVLIALVMVTFYLSCNRLTGNPDPNQMPEVYFVNVPFDSSTFSYAPVVHWTGHDPDGQITQFQYRYRGDTTQAALDAYAAWISGDKYALTNYCNSLPEFNWEPPTESTEDTIYLRRNETDTLTQAVFMLRAFDDLGGVSLVKGRLFSRTNLAPYAPKVRWALDAALDNPLGYQVNYAIADTLFWGDTVTTTYAGIGFLWQGSDPDSREFNIITLRFSYLLVNADGDTMPFAIRNDSNHVVGYRIGWSDTTTNTQVTFSMASLDTNWYRDHAGRSFNFDSHFTFHVEVFDDGFTKSDTTAVATFNAVKPLFNDPVLGKQLLIVDWNKNIMDTDTLFGLRDYNEIRDFYLNALPEGFELAEQVRQAFYDYPGGIEEPFEFSFGDQVQWFNDNNIGQPGGVYYDYIRRFKWIWVINDNPPRTPPSNPDVMDARLKTFSDYMNIGGQVMMSGRRFFQGNFNLATPGLLQTTPAEIYFRNYFNLSTIYPRGRAQSPDFGGVSTTAPTLAGMTIDTAVVRGLNFSNHHYDCLPEIDYFGRSGNSSGGYDYSETVFNYQSCTAADSYNVYDVDCAVISSTPSIAYLAPFTGHDRILGVTRVFNVTRNVYGEFMYVDREQHSDGSIGPWRIVVSTPASAGAWTTADALQVDYSYIPISPDHDQPVALDFIKIQGVVEINNGQVFFSGRFRFRSALFTFPLSFMDNDTLVSVQIPYLGNVISHPAAFLIATQLLYFNTPRRIEFGGGGEGIAQPYEPHMRRLFN